MIVRLCEEGSLSVLSCNTCSCRIMDQHLQKDEQADAECCIESEVMQTKLLAKDRTSLMAPAKRSKVPLNTSEEHSTLLHDLKISSPKLLKKSTCIE